MEAFDAWWKELRKLYSERYAGLSLTDSDQESWRDYWEDGFSPKDAIYDEAQNG